MGLNPWTSDPVASMITMGPPGSTNQFEVYIYIYYMNDNIIMDDIAWTIKEQGIS